MSSPKDKERKEEIIKMTKEEYLKTVKYYSENYFIPEDRIRSYLEQELGGEIKIIN